MPNIDLSILNQRQTPAFYADVFANRPAAGFVGRIFISTNTFAFYRDNGTSWDLIGGPGTGTVTGTGANGQVTFWNGASTITGSNDLFWDATNGHLGVNTNAPGTALDVHHDQPTVAILNQTVATNDVRIGFQNNGVGLWRIGAFYNAGANDFGIFDAVGNIQPVTVKKTTGQVLIGTSTVGSGKLVVASATSDNGVQIVGASAPSLRIDNAESGPTKRAGFGISTATNNFIQGSADRDFCMFNGSTTASPILFGIYDTTNVQEAARISAARNFLVGTTTDGGQKLQVNGGARATGYYLDNMTAGSGALYYNLAQNRVTLANYNASGILEFEVNGGNQAVTIQANKNAIFYGSAQIGYVDALNQSMILSWAGASAYGKIQTYSSSYLALNPEGNNVSIGDTTNFNKFSVGNVNANAYSFLSYSSAWGSGTQIWNGIKLGAAGDNGGAGCDIRAYSDYANTGDTFMTFSTSSGVINEGMRLTAARNLLIGTTTDNGNKLQVNGNMTLKLSTFAQQNTNVTTSSVQVATGSGIGVGAFYFVVWFNNIGGSQGNAVLMARAGSLTTISISDGSGCGVSFSVSGATLFSQTTSGSVTMGVTQINM